MLTLCAYLLENFVIYHVYFNALANSLQNRHTHSSFHYRVFFGIVIFSCFQHGRFNLIQYIEVLGRDLQELNRPTSVKSDSRANII